MNKSILTLSTLLMLSLNLNAGLFGRQINLFDEDCGEHYERIVAMLKAKMPKSVQFSEDDKDYGRDIERLNKIIRSLECKIKVAHKSIERCMKIDLHTSTWFYNSEIEKCPRVF